MTLVRSREENNTPSTLPIMLGVQQQQPHLHHHHGHHHHHHSHHHGLHASSNPSTGQTHRGNVIVSTNSVPNNENIKTLQQQQQQQQQQHGCNKKSTKIYAQNAGPYGTVPHQPASVARRNARERNRVKQVNNGFATLRQHIPQSVAQALGSNTAGTHGGSRAGSKKLSKVETLRMAVEYIRSLQRLLDDHDGGGGGGASAGVVVSAVGSDTVVTSVLSSSSSVSSTSSNSSTRCSNNIVVNANNNSDLHSRHQHLRQNQSPPVFAPTPCSEASSSPTPSFVSDASSAGSQGYGPSSGTIYSNRTDGYDNYEPMSPEDEELLDVISWWQQSQ